MRQTAKRSGAAESAESALSPPPPWSRGVRPSGRLPRAVGTSGFARGSEQLEDLLAPAADGRGGIHLLDASRLVHEAPKVYATFLLWLLAELFEQLPERGDSDRPLLVLFFDEAHLLFGDTPKALQERLLEESRERVAAVTQREELQKRLDEEKRLLADAEARLGNAGRILVRKSGTEPLIRVMAEGEDEKVVRAVVRQIASAIEEVAA